MERGLVFVSNRSQKASRPQAHAIPTQTITFAFPFPPIILAWCRWPAPANYRGLAAVMLITETESRRRARFQ
jgi:hypothetical protein